MSGREGVVVSKMVNQGEGVWVSYKGTSSLELFHTTSRTSLQNIDIKSTLCSILKRGYFFEGPFRKTKWTIP